MPFFSPWSDRRNRSARVGLALVAALCAGAGWLVVRALHDPAVPFLPARAGAAWILYPTPADTLPQPAVAMDTVFRRTFVLGRRPETAILHVLWSRRGAVAVNGELAAASAPEGRWKRPREADIAKLLHPGENTIEARSVAAEGPPALWLSLNGAGFHLGTDESWAASLAGASWQRARRADSPLDARSLPGAADPAANPRPLREAQAHLPLLALFAAVTLLLLGLFRLWEKRRRPGPLSRRETALLLLAVAAVWGTLFWNDRHLAPLWGFDSPAHLEYVRTVLERGTLPLADQGWEMYQPPLYYLTAAALLRLTGHTGMDEGAVVWLRGLGWAAGMLQCAALLGALRLLFADRLRPLLAGLSLAVFLPMQIYMFQYVSNEGLHAAFSSLALFLTLRILARDDASLAAHLGLGAVLGLALLAKFSALVTCAVVVTVLAGRLLARRVRAPRIWARTVGALGLAALALSGWHYVRVAWRFGSPVVGNWDRITGFSWWMDPGYATAGTFFRFGRSFTAPLLSAFHGLPDALYSTLWGDGLLGGASVITVRPPWNYGLMAAGYLLALAPMLVLLAGLVVSLVRLVRAPRAEGFLLLGVLGATGFAVLAMSLKLPYYAQAKAFYGLAALTALCALAGDGFAVLTGRSRAVALFISLLLGVWAVNALVTFWIPGGVSGHPTDNVFATLDPAGLLGRSAAAARQGNSGEAISLARQATALAPDHPFVWLQLGASLARTGADREAVAALREALRVSPRNPRAHEWLSRLYARNGEAGRTRYHEAYARRLGAPTLP